MKNHLGMESHPTDDWAFWDNKKEDLEKARLFYNEALTGDVDSLHKLMDWVWKQAILDEIYSRDGE